MGTHSQSVFFQCTLENLLAFSFFLVLAFIFWLMLFFSKR